ncbi:MAG: hypothetical protein BRC45_00155 [Cyanobacteria bacterium QS_5_48_63]|nr:MAG: hypothetical protein BRC45_00155 [Cyanobacteria bacterium QS_5_48_63]
MNHSPAKPGRKRQISEEASQKLAERLSQQQGFESYEEIRLWLEHECGLEPSYSVVYQTTRYLLESNQTPQRPECAARLISKRKVLKTHSSLLDGAATPALFSEIFFYRSLSEALLGGK